MNLVCCFLVQKWFPKVHVICSSATFFSIGIRKNYLALFERNKKWPKNYNLGFIAKNSHLVKLMVIFKFIYQRNSFRVMFLFHLYSIFNFIKWRIPYSFCLFIIYFSLCNFSFFFSDIHHSSFILNRFFRIFRLFLFLFLVFYL